MSCRNRTLIVCLYFYPSNIGGPSKTLFDLAVALVAAGCPVTVVSSDGGVDDGRIKSDRWTSIEGIRALYCHVKTKLSHSVLYHAVKEINIHDVIYVNSFFFIPSLFVVWAALKKKKRVIWSPRGETMAVNGNRLKLIWMQLIKTLFAKKVIFHATTEIEKADMLRYLGKDVRIKVIPNYLDVPPVLPAQPSEPYILFVGRIAPIKKIENIVEALSLSRFFIEGGYRFKIAGPVEDKYLSYYHELGAVIARNNMTDRVEFVGNLNGEEKYRAYRNAACLMLVSSSENFGNVVVEALSQGTPVIASLGTPWRVLQRENAGFHVDNTPQSLAQTLDVLLSQTDEERTEMRNAALELSKHYTIQGNIAQWIELVGQN